MTTREQWLALADRCEKATGLDREIDVLIGLAVDWQTDATKPLREVVAIYGGTAEFVARCIGSPVSIYSHDEHMPRWSASLDAITALIERELPGWEMRVSTGSKRRGLNDLCCGELDQFPSLEDDWPWEYDWRFAGFAKTPALALCAAFCRAMAEKA